jgi:hypothetical protein
VDIVGQDLSGSEIRLRLGPGFEGRRALVFLTSSCESCINIWQSASPARDVAVVTPDRATESARQLTRVAPPGLTLVMSSAAWFDYAVPGAPWLVIVESGTVALEARVPAAWSEVTALVEEPDA